MLGVSPERIKALRAVPDLATEVAVAAMGDDSSDLSKLGEDAGYGPVRLHDPKRTAEFARFLENHDLASCWRG